MLTYLTYAVAIAENEQITKYGIKKLPIYLMLMGMYNAYIFTDRKAEPTIFYYFRKRFIKIEFFLS